MRIAVTAPVFIKNNEHKKYLDLFTASIVSGKHDIVFIPVENYVNPALIPISYIFNHEPENIHITKGIQPQSVAAGWNKGIALAFTFSCDYVLVCNTDIVLKSNAIDRLVAFAEAHPEAVMWTAAEYVDLANLEECPEDENFSEHPHFSCFMVKADFFKHVGTFDENLIPAYMEDGDMHARLALANKQALIYGGARFYHFGSRTIKSDQELWQANGQTFPKNQQYFLEKWGHPVVGNVDQMRQLYYKTPYNEPDKPLSYWRE